ncbi:type IV pilus assembly PilZ [Pseudomonas mucidolens]|nr:type IV pilus assembly PilZ [Pseudomonas mucidolens]
MLISELPMMVEVDFELRLKIPGPGGDVFAIDLTARCLWSHEDINPLHYDSGFGVVQAGPEYRQLIKALSYYFSFDPLQASA